MNIKYLLCIFLLNTVNVYSKPLDPSDKLDDKEPVQKIQCCIDHAKKPSFPLEVANYDCSQLTDFGKKRCDSVYTGNVCTSITREQDCTIPCDSNRALSSFSLNFRSKLRTSSFIVVDCLCVPDSVSDKCFAYDVDSVSVIKSPHLDLFSIEAIKTQWSD